MILDPRIPELVHPVIEHYVRLTARVTAGLIDASYIIGSIALGEFNENFSDIDFLSILSRRATPVDIEHLRGIHQFIEKSYLQWNMSGSYVQASDLGKLDNHLAPHLQFHDGIFHEAAQKGINSVTWWELKNHAIPILGTSPGNFSFAISWDVLIGEMREDLNSYWRSWTRNPKRIMVLYSDWGIQWAVFGVLRQYFTFKENSITTKMRAAEYALGCLPRQWHLLIQEAINIRQGKRDSFYRSRFGRMVETIRFLNYVIGGCNVHWLP